MPFPWPPELLEPWMVDEAVDWILRQPVDRKIVRKYMIIEWAGLTGYALTGELVKRVYGGEDNL